MTELCSHQPAHHKSSGSRKAGDSAFEFHKSRIVELNAPVWGRLRGTLETHSLTHAAIKDLLSLQAKLVTIESIVRQEKPAEGS